MIRIAYVIATLDQGGAEEYLTTLAAALDKEEFQPEVFCLTRGGPLEAPLKRAGVPVHILGKRKRLDVLTFAKLVKMLWAFSPDIVHTYLFTANSYGRAAALLAGVHHRVASELSTDPWKRWPQRMVDRALTRISSVVLANCEAVKTACVSRGISEEKIVVIHGGIDVERFTKRHTPSLRKELGIRRGASVVGFLGRLVPEKGIETLIKAMRHVRWRLHESVLLIAGTGPSERRLKLLAGRLKSVRFLGHIKAVEPFYRALDVFVLPSKWEGLPVVLLEAMASGCPVVATDVGSARELIEDGRTGLIVPRGSPDALSQAIERVLLSPDLAEQMAGEAKRFVSECFDQRHMIDKMCSLYRRSVSAE